MVICMEIIIERTPKGWTVADSVKNNRQYVSSKQMNKLFGELKEEKFNRVFYTKTDDLVICIADGKIRIKDYDNIKNRAFISQIKNKVNRSIIKGAVKRINKTVFGKGVTIILVSTMAIGAAKGGYTVIKGMNTDVKQVEASEPLIENDLLINTDDFEIVEPEQRGESTTDQALSEIDELFNKYADIFLVDQETKQYLYTLNLNLLLGSQHLELDIMNIMYDYYEDNIYQPNILEPNNYSEEEQELAILKYAKIVGIEDENILTTMLAVHELETGHGQSEWCRSYYNLGGVMDTNPNDPSEVSIKHYPNLDVAAFDYVKVFVRIMDRCKKEDWYNENYSLEYNMNPIYCTEKMNSDDPEWYEIVSEIKEEIKDSGKLQELVSKLDNNKRL